MRQLSAQTRTSDRPKGFTSPPEARGKCRENESRHRLSPGDGFLLFRHEMAQHGISRPD